MIGIGSIVVSISGDRIFIPSFPGDVDSCPSAWPVKGCYYTVTDIDESDGGVWLVLAEFPESVSFGIDDFREIIFPEDLMSQVTEALDRELVLADKK